MQSSSNKIGSAIAVCGCRAGAGTSTLAAMFASLLAVRGEKTLLISTDVDIPYDAVSILADDIESHHMDELAVMENSLGITSDKLLSCVTYLNDTLGYIRSSTPLTSLVFDAARTMNNILKAACNEFKYVVLDVGYEKTDYMERVLLNVDMIVNVLTQDPKAVAKTAARYKSGHFGTNKFVVPVVADYRDEGPCKLEDMEKATGVTEVFGVRHSGDVAKAYAERDMFSYVYKTTGVGGFFGKRRKPKVAIGPVSDLDNILVSCLEALAQADEKEAE